MDKLDLILAELRELHSKVDAMLTPAIRAARLRQEKYDAETIRAEQEHRRGANAPAARIAFEKYSKK